MKPLILVILLVLVSGCGSQGASQISSEHMEIWQELPNERIVFVSKAEHPEGELYLIYKNGTLERLTKNNRHENNPALSFDGKKIAFHAGPSEADPQGWEIYIMDLESKQETQLTDNDYIDGHPDWSPDGEKIVFAAFIDDEGRPAWVADIYTINIDGTGLERLTDSVWGDNDPEWSPDGSMIAFKSSRDTKHSDRLEIFVMDADGSNQRRLTETTGWHSDHDPSWSPDSRYISFMRFEGTRPWTDLLNLETLINEPETLLPWRAYKVDLDGNVVQLTDTDSMTTLPVYSDDGKKILYIRIDFIIVDGKISRAEHSLEVIDSDGANPETVFQVEKFRYEINYIDW